MKKLMLLILAGFLALGTYAYAGEHGGKEHGGKEHGGSAVTTASKKETILKAAMALKSSDPSLSAELKKIAKDL